LYVHDLERTKEFYENTLELPLISYVPGKHIFFKAGNSVLLCFNPEDSKHKKSPPGHFGGGKQHFAFEVLEEDYQKSKDWIQQKGITITDTVILSGGK
jgi:catechol 2,3-dioxygenase-like lactoylglutathione lyase family enzyme